MSQYINRPSFKPGENKPICMKNVTPSLRKRKNGSTFNFIRPIGKTNDSPVARFIPEEFSNVTMFDEETSIGTNIKLVQKLDQINEALDNGDIDIIMAGRHMVKLLDKNVIFDSNVINISTQIASKLNIPNDPQELVKSI